MRSPNSSSQLALAQRHRAQEDRAAFRTRLRKRHDGRAEIDCSICMCALRSADTCQPLAKLGCKHEFHKDCLAEWTKRNQSCPLCRVACPHSGPSKDLEKDMEPLRESAMKGDAGARYLYMIRKRIARRQSREKEMELRAKVDFVEGRKRALPVDMDGQGYLLWLGSLLLGGIESRELRALRT